MAKKRWVRKTLSFQGRQSAGKCDCPVCGSGAIVHPYPKGEKWATLQCPQCGWYQVPTMHAPATTYFEVQVLVEEEIMPRAKK